ncbi:hypothetical protein [Arenibaculum pallidiluteum]|uniref:hypothetical protein n=1 Tax=Arenibaculum pallidiluteum TaxID=2812559 RepID=UPI001A9615F9|nr:hypothetical protein [Arenibaculum pallidiluteum]
MDFTDIAARCRDAIQDLRGLSGPETAGERAQLARTIRTLRAAIHAMPRRGGAPLRAGPPPRQLRVSSGA